METKTIQRMDLQAIYEWTGARAREAALQWFKQQSANNYAALYLYYKVGELRVAEDCPAGFTLATGERLRVNATVDQQQAWINNVARRTPFLPDCI